MPQCGRGDRETAGHHHADGSSITPFDRSPLNLGKEVEMDFETNTAGKQEVLASKSRGKPIVARIWFGRTRKELADEYLPRLCYNYCQTTTWASLIPNPSGLV